MIIFAGRALRGRRSPLALAILAGALFITGGVLANAVADTSYTALISQKGREFTPNILTLARGQSILIVNDDADLLHHAYIDSETFSFDSGDQEPGSRTLITFAVAGDFKVLCGIHPKMKLFVHVN